MSFLKQLLKPFVEFDESNRNPQPQQKHVQPQPATPVKPAAFEPVTHPLINLVEPAIDNTHVAAYSPGGVITEPLPEHKQYFEKLIDEANQTNPLFHGADFKEFIDHKINIDDIPDEAIKYQTAYNILKSSGLTKEKLLSTGQEYLNIIGRDLNAFQGAHAQQYKKEVGQKQLLVRKKSEELQQLTQKLNALKGEVNQLIREINAATEKSDITRNSFLLAGENKQNEIQEELQKIANYF